ncbi:hypothetical protein OQZ33_21530 [Pedobacter sp. MC2016-05]|uniref:MauE/DoxX family redox-associated membrane protein n=1 Tax=Pedobacter sp. MC2016-05 TaxID=2994474 RepID=UPI0022482C9C|nr:MauE/DoxX family redox-associated membrane protein [Pedobacter sp. MC2016-05]MCX2476930.1 hypothetical protein [Pedobacter sp. MC2016-05]
MKPAILNLRRNLITLGYALLILLWSYTGLSKIIDHTDFQNQLERIFPSPSAIAIAIGIPILEIAAAVSLAFKSFRTPGLYLSLLLMAIFTIYVYIVVAGYLSKAPCSCGGIISALSWKAHLVINILFLFLVIYLLFTRKKGKEVAVTP